MHEDKKYTEVTGNLIFSLGGRWLGFKSKHHLVYDGG